MGKYKWLIIIPVSFLILVAAFLTVSRSSMINLSSSKQTGGYSEGMGMVEMGAPIAMERDVAVQSMPGNKFESSSIMPPQDGNIIPGAEKKVIKNGSLTLNVGSVDWSAGEISRIAKENEGDVFSSNVFKNAKDLKSGTIVVKVPVKNFEKAMAEIKKIAAAVVRESTSGQDVTEEYLDIESRIRNKKAEEEAYKRVLDQATKISDILEITQAVSRVRGEIEALEGRLRYLGGLADMSTVTVSLSEDAGIVVSESWRPIQVAKDAVNALIQKAQGFVNFMIVLVILVAPVALLYLLLVYVLWRIGKAIYLKIKNRNVQS